MYILSIKMSELLKLKSEWIHGVRRAARPFYCRGAQQPLTELENLQAQSAGWT